MAARYWCVRIRHLLQRSIVVVFTMAVWMASLRAQTGPEWGLITIQQPKIWQFERVNALLDGLLRDIEGVSLADLVQLNASAQNGSAIRFIQTALELGVQYDQAAKLNAHNSLQNWQTQHEAEVQRYDRYNEYIRTLTEQRIHLTNELFDTSNTVNRLQTLKDEGKSTDDQNKALEAATNRAKALQA